MQSAIILETELVRADTIVLRTVQPQAKSSLLLISFRSGQDQLDL